MRAAAITACVRSPTGRSGSSASGRRSSCCGAGSTTRARPAAARRSSRWSCSRAMPQERSTRRARTSTAWRLRRQPGGPPARDRLPEERAVAPRHDRSPRRPRRRRPPGQGASGRGHERRGRAQEEKGPELAAVRTAVSDAEGVRHSVFRPRRRRACGCAAKYVSRRRLSVTCVYSSVVARSAWPSISWTRAQIGAALQQVGGERVAQQVRVDAPGSSPAFCQAAQDQERAGAGERASLVVQEQFRPEAAVEVGAAAGEVAAQRLGRRAADRDDALLAALADAADEPLVEIDPRALEPDRLADAQPGAVEQLDEGGVAQRARRRAGRGLDQALGLAARASAGASAAGAAPPARPRGCRCASRGEPDARRTSGSPRSAARSSPARDRPRGAPRGRC